MKTRTRKPKPSKPRTRINPLRIDPTRTGLLRAKMMKELNRKFVRLAFDIYNLVAIEDAFGLENAIVGNVFCPTGPGGGIDPTCSPGEGKPNKDDKPKPRKSKAKVKVGAGEHSDKTLVELRELRSDFEAKLASAKAEFRALIEASPGYPAEGTVERERAAKVSLEWTRAEESLKTVNETIANRERVIKVLDRGKVAKSLEEVASLVGAPDDATVTVYGRFEFVDELFVHVSHPNYTASRTLTAFGEKKIASNNSFFLSWSATKGKGVGSGVFLDQVENLKEAGYNEIRTWAAKGSGMNGYYSWPRMGYDQPISAFRDKRTRERISKAFPEAKTVLDVMATPEGRAWWKKNGTNMRSAVFDLREGSRSLAVLAAYIEERKSRKVTANALTVNALPFRSSDNEDDIPPESVEGAEEIEVDADGEPVLSNEAILTSNTPRQQWRFETRLDQLKSFEAWLRSKLVELLLSKTDEMMWEKYAEDGFRRGAGRAFDDAKRGDMTPAERRRDDFLREMFANPVSTDKIRLLASRSFTDLKGVTEATATQLSRTLTDGFVRGASPREIARDLVKTVDDIGRARALTIARTEVIRAHADGQLHALGKMGVREVGVAVEWSTTGDPKVCPLCVPMRGVVLSLSEAEGMIPRHPNCRCAWVPANVGEPTEGQKRTRARIVSSIAASRARERGKKASGWGKIAVTAQRPKSVLNDAGAVYPLGSSLNDLDLNVFCPTGPGGGIDPSCSPGGRGPSVRGVPMAGLSIAPKIKDYLTKDETAEYKRLASERGTLLNDIRLGRATDEQKARSEEIARRLDQIDSVGRDRLKKGDRPADSYDQPDFLNLPKETADAIVAAKLKAEDSTAQLDMNWYRDSMARADADLSKTQKKVAALQTRLDNNQKKREKLNKEIDEKTTAYLKATDVGDVETKARLNREINAAALEIDRLLGDHLELQRDIGDRAWAIISKDSRGGSKIGLRTNVESSNYDLERSVGEVKDRLEGVLSDRLKNQFDGTRARETPTGRAYFAGYKHGHPDDAVHLNKWYDPATAAHEYGHSLESHATVEALSHGFLHHRVGAEPAKHMGAGYGDGEVGREDNWGKAFGSHARYVGKHYSHRSTEVLSMGMEYLFRNPAKFARDDPEHFKFVLGILNGKLL